MTDAPSVPPAPGAQLTDSVPYDWVVIGGGPAGYAAAIRAGQLGLRVACIEQERAGGTCLNWGCIPSKALLKAAEVYQNLLHAADWGLRATDVGFDFEAVMARSRRVADTMGKGIEFLFKKNKVHYLVGHGQVLAPGQVLCRDAQGQQTVLHAQRILIATGCTPAVLPGVTVDGQRVMTSRQALARSTLPASVAIVGGGAIGAEFAYFWRAFGAEVTLIEMQPRLLPLEDEDVSAVLTTHFKKQGIQVFTGARAEAIQVDEHGVRLDILVGEQRSPWQGQHLLLAAGVRPRLEGVLAPGLSLDCQRGYLVVDDDYQTSVPGIYAAGDIIGPPWLAHVATHEAVEAINRVHTQSSGPRHKTRVPSATYCYPQVASVGLTEAALKAQGTPYRVGKFPLSASGKAVAANKAEGFIKVLSDPEHGEILGAHIIGPDATELIAEYVLAMQTELTLEDIAGTMHAHPTLSEGLKEAAESILGTAIHI